MRDEWRWVGPDGFEYSGSIDRLRHALASGELSPQTPVWRAGFEIWLAADTVPELAQSLQGGRLPSYALESRPFSPAPDVKTPPPVGISADHVVVAPPGQQMTALTPPTGPAYVAHAQPLPPKKSWLLPVLVIVIGLLLAAVIGLGALLLMTRPEPTPSARGPVPAGSTSAAATATAAGTSAPAAAGVSRCTASRNKALFKAVYGKVPLIVSRTADKSQLLVGFAETRLVAHALAVDSRTLDVRAAKNERAPAPIVGAVPIAKGGDVALAIDLEDPRIRFSRTIDATPPFRIGIGKEGFARLDEKGALTTLWKGDAEAESTVPRVDGSAELGLFVTVRRGGLGGRLHGAWLGADGSPRSAISAVETQGSQVGTPTAAVGSGGVVLAAAVRQGEDGAWDVHLGKASSPKVPARLSPLAVPRASPDVQRMSPAIAALSGGRWLLQWTERGASGHVVRVAVLDADLKPTGDSTVVSPAGSDSGQGELWVREDRAVSLHLVKSATGHELWGAVVSCQ